MTAGHPGPGHPVSGHADGAPATGPTAGLWQALVEQSPVAVAVIGADGSFSYANPAAGQLFAASTGPELVGRPVRDLLAPDGGRVVADLLAGVLAGEAVPGRRWRMVRRDGTGVDVELNAGPIAVGDETAVRLELRDVSAEVAAEVALTASEQRWKRIFEGSPVGIGLADHHGHFVAVNQSLCRLLGRTEAELLGRSSAEITRPDDLEPHAPAGSLVDPADDGVVRVEKRYLRPDGQDRWAWLTVTHVPGPSGETWTLAHVQDVTARKVADEAAAASRTNLRAVGEVIRQIQAGSDARQTIVDAGLQLADASYVSLLEPDDEGRELRVTASTEPRLREQSTPIWGGSSTAEVYRTGQSLFVPDAVGHPKVAQALMALTDAQSMYLVPVRFEDTVGGVLIVAWDHLVPDLDDRRAEAVTLLVYHAGVALRQATLVGELRSQALRDPLTRLPNRRSWDDALQVALSQAGRSGKPLSVALVDLDAFKAFNDEFGHPAGDELLQEVASAMRAAVRDGDSVARWGGEEFAILLADCPSDETSAVLERLCQAMPRRQTCSIGFATWDGHEDAQQLVRRADVALYAAKRAGRNRVVQAR